MALLPKKRNMVDDVTMNMNTACFEPTADRIDMNTTCLEPTADRIELTETSTIRERRLISHILAWIMIGVMTLSGLMWLSILLAAFVHFVSPAR
jgi:hypothetical protein